MNILFHVASGLATVVLLTDTRHTKKDSTTSAVLCTAVLALFLGVIAHGALDYIPHCYPINTKFDMIFGLLLIISLVGYSRGRYKWIMFGGLLGCILPDLIDLIPAILNKYLGLGLPQYPKLFPWHWQQYSGSIYNGDCGVSIINHSLLLLTVSLVLWSRKVDLKKILPMLQT